MKNWFPLSLMAFATFFWGATFIMVKATIAIIPLNFFLFMRFGLATLLTLPIVINRVQLGEKKLWIQGSILGVLLFLSYYFQTVGLLFTTPAKAAFITGLNVVIIPIIGFIFLQKRLAPLEVLAVILSVCGTVLLTVDFQDVLHLNVGDLIILLTAICIALHIIYTEQVIDTNLIELLWIQFLIMTSLAGILTFFGNKPVGSWYASTTVVFTLIFTVLFATIFAFAAQFYAQQKKIVATHIGIIFLLEPVFALGIDFLVGIQPKIPTLIGMTMIFISFGLITIKMD